MNTTRDLFLSYDERGCQYVNQESNFLDTTEPVIEVGPNVNNGTEWGCQYVNQESKWDVLDAAESVNDMNRNVNNGTELWKADSLICTGGKTFDMKLDPCLEQVEVKELHMRKPWLGTPTVSGGDEPFTTQQLQSMSTLHLLRLEKYRSRHNMILNDNRKQSGPSDQIEADPQMSVHTDGAGRVSSLEERSTKNCEDKNVVNGLDVGATGTSDDLPTSWSSAINKITSDIRNVMKSLFKL